MKKILCAMLSAVCMVSAAGAADRTGSLSPRGAQAYLDTIQNLQNTYGKASVAGADSPLDGMWQGLSLARLVDFDGDGIPELYCGMGMQGQRLYTWDGGLRQLAIPESVSNFGSDVSPETRLYVGPGRAYLVDACVEFFGAPVRYYTKQGNEMRVALTYTRNVDAEPQPACTLDGASVSPAQLQSALDALTAGMTEHSYSYWRIADMDIGIELPETVGLTVSSLRALTHPQARVSSHKLKIDGSPAAISAYEINGSNYFKLRDLAMALSGTAAQFDVAWNGAHRRIDLTNGAAYTPVGGENSDILPVSEQAAVTTASVWLDGRQLGLTAYEIAGNNFFKLRDLGEALGFSVGWDGAAGTVSIETGARGGV